MPLTALMDSLDTAARALDMALAVRDIPTHNHSARVIKLAMRLGHSCDLSSGELKFLGICARFHDIGKIGIPDSILCKPGKLTRDEFAIIKQHAQIGGSIIRHIPLKGVDTLAHIIEHHHERYDGMGYPAGLSGTSTPLLARIIAIVDSYDAITSRRSYHDAESCEKGLAIIAAGRGKQFDPELTDLFIAGASEWDPRFT